MSYHDGVELIDQNIRIPAQHHAALAAALAEGDFDPDGDDVSSAFGQYDLEPIFEDETDDVIYLEQTWAPERFAGEDLFRALAPYVAPGSYLVFHQRSYCCGESDEWTEKVLFDGQGGYTKLLGTVVFEDRTEAISA